MTGMATRSAALLQKSGKNAEAVMIIVGMMSGVLQTPVQRLYWIPVAIGIAAKSGYSRSKLLMPLVFAAAMRR